MGYDIRDEGGGDVTRVIFRGGGKIFFFFSNFPRILGFYTGLKIFFFFSLLVLFYVSGKCFTAILRSRAERVGEFRRFLLFCSSPHLHLHFT